MQLRKNILHVSECHISIQKPYDIISLFVGVILKILLVVLPN